jgi:hypothetical protein
MTQAVAAVGWWLLGVLVAYIIGKLLDKHIDA